MQIKANFHNALEMLIDVCINDKGEGVFLKDIAERRQLSVRFLDQVVAILKGAGILSKRRGYKFGYKLTRDASTITILDIYEAFENQLQLYYCLAKEDECEFFGHCITQCYLSDLNGQIRTILKETTLKQLICKHQNLIPLKQIN